MMPDASVFAQLIVATSVAENTNRSFTPLTAAEASLVAWRMRQPSPIGVFAAWVLFAVHAVEPRR